MQKRVFLACNLFAASVLPTQAGPLEDGYAAYQQGAYEQAFKLLRPLADGGNGAAQFSIGYMYAKGRGIQRDDAEAIKWYRLAAANSNADAEFNLGRRYDDGQGVSQDYAEAAHWYLLAAAQGNVAAEVNLGFMYSHSFDDLDGHTWELVYMDPNAKPPH